MYAFPRSSLKGIPLTAAQWNMGCQAMGFSTFMGKVRIRLWLAPPSAYLWGWLLRRSFTKGGIIAAMPGWPKPRVINRGGQILVENCSFFPGVRLEVWKG